MPGMIDTSTVQSRLVAIGFILLGCVLSFMSSSISGWLVLTVAVVGMVLLGNPKALLVFYTVWITVSPYILECFSDSDVLTWTDEALAAAMLLVMLINTETHKRRSELKIVNWSLITLACLIVISALANRVPKMLAVHFCMQYMRFYVLFFFTYLFVGNAHSKTAFAIIVGLFVAQLIPNVGWLLGVNPMHNRMSGPDICIGTGLGANTVAYFSVAFICLGLSVMTNPTPRGEKLSGLAMIIVGVLQLYFSFTIHAYLILGVCIFLQLVVTGIFVRYTQLLVLGGVMGIVALVLFVAYNSQISADNLGDLTPEYVATRWQNMLDGPKGQTYHDIVTLLPDDIPFPILGAGPGNAGSNVGMYARTPLAEKYFDWVLLAWGAEYQKLSEGSSFTGGPNTGILALLSELGPIGLIAYWGLYVYAGCRISGFVWKKKYEVRYQRVLAEAFIPTIAMLFILAWLEDCFYVAFVNNTIWIWAALVWVPLESEPATNSVIPA